MIFYLSNFSVPMNSSAEDAPIIKNATRLSWLLSPGILETLFSEILRETCVNISRAGNKSAISSSAAMTTGVCSFVTVID